MVDITEAVFLLGRILLGGFFVINGFNHLRHRDMMVPYAEAKGVPAPALAVVGTGALLIGGGLSLLLGFLPAVGLSLLALFLVGVTPKMHAYWTVEDPEQRSAEQVNFMKNVGLLGAVLTLFLVTTPWPLALTL